MDVGNKQVDRRKRKNPAVGWVLKFGAGNEIRTRDPDLGKVVLYQLSYSRIPVQSFCESGPSQKWSAFYKNPGNAQHLI